MEKHTGPRRLFYTLTENDAFAFPSPRRTLCPAYEECLDYAVRHFWISFTCKGCRMEELIVMGKIKEIPPPEPRITWEVANHWPHGSYGFVTSW
jgi:hypothetical protein